MGGNVTTGSQSTSVNNPAVNGLVTKLSTGLANEYSPGKSLYVQPGANTTQGQAASITAANDPNYMAGVKGATADFADIAAGNRFGTNDPGFAALRSKVAGDTQSSIDQAYNSAGVFGSDQNQRAAGEGVAGALANLDYGNFQNDQARQTQAATLLPQLAAAGQFPSSVQQSVGAAQDASANAAAAGPTDYLAKLIASATGAAGASGQTTKQQTPLWSMLLGLGASAL